MFLSKNLVSNSALVLGLTTLSIAIWNLFGDADQVRTLLNLLLAIGHIAILIYFVNGFLNEKFGIESLFQQGEINSCNGKTKVYLVTNLWLFLCTVWFLFYLFSIVNSLVEFSSSDMGNWSTYIDRALNSLDSLLMLMLFYVMQKKEVLEWKHALKKSFVCAAILVLFYVLEVILISLDLNLRFIFVLSAGLISGATFLLFFSRISDRKLGISTGWIALLMLYGLIQIVDPLLRLGENKNLVIAMNKTLELPFEVFSQSFALISLCIALISKLMICYLLSYEATIKNLSEHLKD